MEEWRPVIGYEGRYEVSALGRVRRIGTGRGVKPGRLLAQTRINSGYLVCSLWRQNRSVIRLVHRLVAAAFSGPCPLGHEVNHKDLDKSHNAASNLEYLTRSANLFHRVSAGIGRGSTNGAAKLTEDQVREILVRYRPGGNPGYKALAHEYGVCWEAIRNIVKGRAWGWLE